MNNHTASLSDLPPNMQNKIIQSTQGCWEWIGSISNRGYGQVGVIGKVRSTHRVAYELLVGPISDGLHIDHLCRNRSCCNPAHLEAVTPKVNAERTPNAQKTHCVHGHPLAGRNLIVRERKSGLTTRGCRVCGLDDNRRFREANRQAVRRYDTSAHRSALIADGERALAESESKRGAA